jgi:hypothetical protein
MSVGRGSFSCLVGLLALLAGATGQDIRGIAMGRLSLIVRSDLNRLDLVDFGDNPAGLVSAPPPFEDEDVPGDYANCELFGSLYREVLSFQEVLSIGQPVPLGAARLLPPQPLNDWWTGLSYPSRPAGFNYRSRRGNSVTRAQADFSHFHLFEPEREDYALSTPELQVAWAHRTGWLDLAFDIMGFDAIERNRVHNTGAGILLGAAQVQDRCDLGVNFGYLHTRGMGSAGTSGEHAARGVGTVIFQPLDLLKLGVNAGYRWATREPGWYHSPGIDVSCILDPPTSMLVVGLDLKWGGSYPSTPDLAWGKEDSFAMVFGAGLAGRSWFAGLEISGLREHEVWQQQPFRIGWTDVRVGGEVDIGRFLVRAGAKHVITGADPGMGTAQGCLTAGLGWVHGPVRLDLAYNRFDYQTFQVGYDLVLLSFRYHHWE